MIVYRNLHITSALNGKNTVGYFHSVQYFSQLYFPAWVGVKFLKEVLVIIPNLPTDNLYKFIALSGVLITILTIYTLQTRTDSIFEKLYVIELENSKLEVTIEHNEVKIRRLNEIIDNSIKEKNGNIHVVNGKLLIRYSTEEVKELISDVENYKFQIKLGIAKSKADIKQIETLNNQLEKSFNWSIFIILIGTVLSVFGFRMWYIKVQKPLDNQISNSVSET